MALNTLRVENVAHNLQNINPIFEYLTENEKFVYPLKNEDEDSKISTQSSPTSEILIWKT